MRGAGTEKEQTRLTQAFDNREIMVLETFSALNMQVCSQAPQAQNTWCMRQFVYIENCMGK